MESENNEYNADRCIACGHSNSYVRLQPYHQCKMSDGAPCTTCYRIEHLESKILEARRVLDDLVKQHRDLKTERNHIHDPITSRLSPEVVSTIFQFSLACVPDGSQRDVDMPSRKGVASPLILGAVCRSWRNIAWSTPSLWTFISVCVNDPDLPNLGDLACQWLARSGSLPLSIHIFASLDILDYDWGDEELFLEHFDPFLDLVNQESSRWHKLDLSLPTSLLSAFCGDLQSHSPLHTLRIRAIHDDWPDQQFSLNNPTPSLYNVCLSRLRFKAVVIEWSNVTEVDIDSFEVEECLELLKQAPHLRRCRFANVSPSRYGQERFPMPKDTFIHHQLHTLIVEKTPGGNSLSLLCDKLSLPELSKFAFITEGYYLPIESLVSFFSRSSCPLQELKIMDARIDLAGIIKLLQATPSITRLDLLPAQSSFYCLPSKIFQLLADSSIARNEDGQKHLDNFLPNLQTFKFRVQTGISWDYVPDVFGPLSELDNPCRRPLKAFHIHLDWENSIENPEFIEKDIVSRLLGILEAGLDLQIGYLSEDLDLIQASMKHHGMVNDGENLTPPYEE